METILTLVAIIIGANIGLRIAIWQDNRERRSQVHRDMEFIDYRTKMWMDTAESRHIALGKSAVWPKQNANYYNGK